MLTGYYDDDHLLSACPGTASDVIMIMTLLLVTDETMFGLYRFVMEVHFSYNLAALSFQVEILSTKPTLIRENIGMKFLGA